MAITFRILARNEYAPGPVHNTAYLQPDNWDDFGHKTLFNLTIFDERGNRCLIGNVKIGFIGQNGGWTVERLPQQFNLLQDEFYSLGQDADYYRNLVDNLSNEMAANVLTALGDVTYNHRHLEATENEETFNISLMRSVHRSTIEHQFRRILNGEAPLTNYDFFYEKNTNNRYSGIRVEFQVETNTKPSSNIHILIGRNGVGKTTLLNNMVDALLPDRGTVEETGYFATRSAWTDTALLNENYFAGVVSVSFSAFDPFTPPADQPDANVGMRYYYVGLKKRIAQQGLEQWGLKNKNDLCRDFTNSLNLCFSLIAKKHRWVNAVRKLESDFNFSEMDLCQLTDMYVNDLSDSKLPFIASASALFNRMSSGHAIVLLSITKLVETVEEKTLVLLDEPESHLHPPLLSAFTRALSDLLVNRNGVAIIATHSPVVLQEVPKSCVSILRRTRLVSNIERPESETFAENVGVLTREVFGLEVSKSGFHDLLANSVDEGKSYEDIEQEYRHQLGFEGKAILRSMIFIRDSQVRARR
ncbi:AAA family ATPase [Aeromonas rivipollensis]|uniref:AAA family ATPase n=1 Tax=Aeromonas rivipollensis TaxID=948519 RepID=UPI00373AEEC0